MYISISNIFKEINTEKYNKQNMAIFITLIFSLGIVYYLPFVIPNSNPIFIIPSLICWVLYTFLVGGYLTLISHNEIHSKQQVIPSIKDFGTVLKYGFFYGIGNFLLTLIVVLVMCFPAIIFGVVFAMIVPTLMATGANPTIAYALMGIFWILMLFASFAIYYLFEMPNILNFFITLKISDFFEFKKGIKFKRERKELYGQFVLKHILLTIITLGLPIILIILSNTLLLSKINISIPQNSVLMITAIITIASVIVFTILFPNLNAQIVKSGPIKLEKE